LAQFCRWLSLLYVCREEFFKMERKLVPKIYNEI
jgi:hypothetical protein